ncbi:hypothetical protein DJ77_00835 [Halorubrum ezzemoulense]|nr:hypothetical protein DJ77_00835 [Halorubrum ezzemoulense]
MSDVHRGDAELLLELLDLRAHFVRRLRARFESGSSKKEHLRAPARDGADRAPQSPRVLLPARELVGLVVEEVSTMPIISAISADAPRGALTVSSPVLIF